MAIDGSIYLQQQAPDILGNVQRGLSLRDMIDGRNQKRAALDEENAVKQAYQKNMVKGADGSISLDQNKLMSDLAGINGQKAYETKRQFDAESQQAKMAAQEKAIKDKAYIGQLLMPVKNQEQHTAVMSKLKSEGYEIDDGDMIFDPSRNQMMAYQGLTAAQQLAERQRQQENAMAQDRLKLDKNKYYSDVNDKNKGRQLEMAKLGLSQEQFETEADLKRRGLSNEEARQRFAENQAAIKNATMAKTGGLSAGQKKVDQEFAKDFNEWSSGGSKNAREEIGKLKSVVSNLKKGAVSTGGFTGLFPDRMTSNSVLSARADVQSSIMNSLRPLLGAAFTEKEGERVIKNTWNEADSTENNMARLERLVTNLENQANDKDKKAAYFSENNATLAGFGEMGAQNQASQTPAPPQSGEVVDGYVYMGGDPSDQSSWKKTNMTAGKGK